MKKTFTLFLTAIFMAGFLTSKAGMFHIMVGNLQFNPNNITVNTGDTIMWIWFEGSHTTTSTQIPIGATAWNELINFNDTNYMYLPVIAGTYNYVCSPHQSMGMTGQFTVVNTSSLSENVIEGATLNGSMIGSDQLMVRFNLPVQSVVTVRMYDLIGNVVGTFLSDVRQHAGSYEERFLLPSLRSGIYMLQLQTAEGVLTKRVLIP